MSPLKSLHFVSVAEAIAQIKSHHHVFIHGGAATPLALISELVQQHNRLENVELMHLHTMGDGAYGNPDYKSSFKVTNLFVGSNMRAKLNLGNVDYLPCFLSEIPSLFRKGIKKVDVALLHITPPDQHGYCSLGTSVDTTRAAIESAKLVIAQVNPRMPRTHGDGIIHISKINFLVEVDEPIPETSPQTLSDAELAIGKNIASIIDDGSTLQMGIGRIPDATLMALADHKHLGIHTETWTDGALDLLIRGNVDNSRKKVHPGKTVSSFVTGSRRLYDFIDDNPSTLMLDVEYVNSPAVIARNPKVCAINSAVEIDLTGQICADSIGHHVISGVGGQVDFIRGASLSSGGKPIIALTSRTNKGQPRLVASLKSGAGVVTTRSHAHWIATEYGIVDLFGLTLSQRAKALIAIAHPEDRETLEFNWRKDYL